VRLRLVHDHVVLIMLSSTRSATCEVTLCPAKLVVPRGIALTLNAVESSSGVAMSSGTGDSGDGRHCPTKNSHANAHDKPRAECTPLSSMDPPPFTTSSAVGTRAAVWHLCRVALKPLFGASPPSFLTLEASPMLRHLLLPRSRPQLRPSESHMENSRRSDMTQGHRVMSKLNWLTLPPASANDDGVAQHTHQCVVSSAARRPSTIDDTNSIPGWLHRLPIHGGLIL
jgi:hypothetical protein